MACKRFTDKFGAEAVTQVSERGYSVTDVAERRGVSSHSLYGWLRERSISREAQKAKKSSVQFAAVSYQNRIRRGAGRANQRYGKAL